jgi:hypothetical protein
VGKPETTEFNLHTLELSDHGVAVLLAAIRVMKQYEKYALTDAEKAFVDDLESDFEDALRQSVVERGLDPDAERSFWDDQEELEVLDAYELEQGGEDVYSETDDGAPDGAGNP